MYPASSTFSKTVYFTRKSFAILSEESDDSISHCARRSQPRIGNAGADLKSIYHLNCAVPNKDFSIWRDAVVSKTNRTKKILTGPRYPNHTSLVTKTLSLSYPSKKFFDKVNAKLKRLRLPPVNEQTEPEGGEICARIMTKPMFVTTVRSGTFLEPPPEVAALLGFRNGRDSTSMNASEKYIKNGAMMYSFASSPRIVRANLHTNAPSRCLSTRYEFLVLTIL